MFPLEILSAYKYIYKKQHQNAHDKDRHAVK